MTVASGLLFTREGAQLVARDAAGVTLFDAGGAPPVALGGRDVLDVAVVGSEIWIADGAGDPPVLHRWSLRGEPIAAPRPLWGSTGDRSRLVPVALGGAAALWTSAPRAIVRGGDPAMIPVPDADFVLPVSAMRWLVCRRDELALREPTAERWSASLLDAGQRAIAGAVLFDGRAAAIHVAGGGSGADQMLILTLANAAPQHRLKLVGVDAVSLAPVRGVALFRSGPHRLTLVDLRFGHVVSEHVDPRQIVDAAIDPTAQQIALRYADDEIQLIAARELFASRRGAASAADADRAAGIAPPGAGTSIVATAAPPPAAAESPSSTGAFHHIIAAIDSVAALAPRPKLDVVDRAAAEALLTRYRALIAARAGRAIARAWDLGTLAFPDQGDLPYRVEVAGLLGHNPSLARGDVERAEREVEAARDDVDAAEQAIAPALSPLGALAAEFGLSGTAQHILLAIAAPAQWGELARFYGILANDEARPLCDELLVQHLLDGEASRLDVARELDRDAPLIRHGLVRRGDGKVRPFRALTVEPIALRRLAARDLDGDLGELRLVAADRALGELLIPAAVKSALIRDLAVPPTGGLPRLVIRGRVGAGRHALLAILAEASGRRLAVIDAAPMLRDLRNRSDQLRLALRRAHVLGLLPCIDGLEHLASDDQIARETVREIVAQHPGALAIRLPWDAEPPIDPGHLAIDLPQLSGDQRLTAWSETLARAGLYVRDVGELAMRYSVGPGAMARAAAKVAHELAPAHGDPAARPDAAPRLERAIRQHLETRLRATANRVTRLATWSQVILPPDIQESLLELIARIKHRRIVYDVWGYDRVMSTSRGVTALFQGGPGTGKTLVASAIANELGMDLYRVDVSRIMSKWIGETEQNLATLFDAAEDGNAIILFDEADSLFGKRTEVRSSVDRYANLEVNYLLQRLDSFEGIAILTTNFGTAIDSAFKRRLSFRLTLPFPDEEMREKLWSAHLPPGAPRAGAFDLGHLARRFRASGGYIRNAALRAAFLAVEEQAPLTQDHLERAIRAEFREIGKLSESGVLE
jgi:hypothetical protein